jgi:transposase
VLHFAEGVSDRQAADLVRGRIDWKYLLELELEDPGFDFSLLSEFRDRLIAGGQAEKLLDLLLDTLKQRGVLKARGIARTDATHVLAAVRQLNRVEIVGETLRRALNELAEAAPEWVRTIAPVEWFARYGRRFEQMRLPKEAAARAALLLTMGSDGVYLWEALGHAPQKAALLALPGVEFMRRLWLQQYWEEVDEAGQRAIHLRESDNQPPGHLRLHSPYDAEARFSAKGGTEWVGFKAHLTETCGSDEAHLITEVTTTPATQADVTALPTLQAHLAAKDLLPREQLVDAAYADAEGVLTAQAQHGIELCTPIREKVGWQAAADNGYDLAHFLIDWERQQVTCPAGHIATQWCDRPSPTRKPAIQVRFSPTVCCPCPARVNCTRAKTGARTLTFLPRSAHEKLQQIRQDQKTSGFWQKYAKRAGMEGTISQGVRQFELRTTRYVGLAKTHLQMLATAVAIDLHRLFDWLQEKPRAQTRTSAFATLAPDPALTGSSWRAVA